MDNRSESTQVQRLQQHIRNQSQQIKNLRSKVDRLEKLWAYSITDPSVRWLYDNRSERMDPTVPIFDEGRAEFHLARYRFAAEYVAGKRVADVACGTGYGVRVLIEEGRATEVIGVDCCAEAIEYASKNHAPQGASYLACRGEETGLEDGTFEIIVSFETLEHVSDDDLLIAEFARLLKPGGTLICSTPNQWPLEVAPHHVRVYDHRTLTQLLNRYFTDIALFNQNSGTDFEYNRGEPAGIVPSHEKNSEMAECYLAVCKLPMA